MKMPVVIMIEDFKERFLRMACRTPHVFTLPHEIMHTFSFVGIVSQFW